MSAKLRVLGHAELLQDGEPVRFRSAKAIELLAFLAVQPERRASRASVAGALYPDSLRSRENLRQTLLYISKSASGLLQTDPSHLSLSDIESDLDAFQRGDLEAYDGAFLPHHDADWVVAVRTNLEQMFVQRLIATADLALPDDPAQAAKLANQAIQIDPYLEQPRRLRWLALERQGERAVAAAERAQYAEFIRKEVGIEVRTSEESPVAPSLTPAERLLRDIALAPEAFEHGRLMAAAESLKEGLRLVSPDHPYVILAWISLSRVQFEVGDTAGAVESIRQARLVDMTPEQSCELCSIEARVKARLGDHEEAERLASRAGQSKLTEIQTEVNLLMSFTSWAKGEYPAAIRRADRAIELAEMCGSQKSRIRGLRSKASALFRMGRHAEAQVCLEEGIGAARSIDRADLEAALGSDLGRLRESLGDLESAHHTFLKAVDALEGTDFRIQYAQALTYLGDLEHRFANYSEARRLHALGVATRRIGGDWLGLATSLRGLGKAQLALGNTREAVEALRSALRYFETFHEEGSMGSARIPLAWALMSLGEKSEALRHARQGALELEALNEESILIRYNDHTLLREAIGELIALLTA